MVDLKCSRGLQSALARRRRISAEIQSINSEFEALMQQVIVQVRESIENVIRLKRKARAGNRAN